MDSPKITYKYYSNPAFCAQSEVVYTQQSPCVSPMIVCSPSKSKRVPPLGANSPRKILPHQEYKSNIGNQRVKTDISDNPLRNAPGSGHDLPPKPGPKPNHRQGSINSIKRNNNIAKVTNARRNAQNQNKSQEIVEMQKINHKTKSMGDLLNQSRESRVLKHRYAEIPDDYDEYSPSKKRIIETEPEEYSVDEPSEEDNEEIPTEIVRAVNGKVHRYAIIPSEEDDEEEEEEEGIVINFGNGEPHSPPTFHIKSPGMPRKQIEATQKLHEFLATPRKVVRTPLKSYVSSPSLRSPTRSQNLTLVSSTPKQMTPATPSKTYINLSPPLPQRNSRLNSSESPRAQQKLDYGLADNGTPKKDVSQLYTRNRSLDHSYDLSEYNKKRDKEHLFIARSTAVISPRLISTRDNESIYAETSVAWKPNPTCATLLLAAAMLALCGGLGASLSFYMMYTIGRKYYLDIGAMSGFTCLILGLLGFRQPTSQLLPNRNYISGYIVISLLSLLSCGALLSLLYFGERYGDGTLEKSVGISVTALGAMCLLLAVVGTVSSYCCGRPPPDNRVANV